MSRLSQAAEELKKRLNKDKDKSVEEDEFLVVAYEVAVEYGIDVNNLIDEYTNMLSESSEKIKNIVRKLFESNSYIMDELNPKLWTNEKLDNEVREHCLKVADSFKSDLEKVFPEIEIEDIKLVGSNANYNYTPLSDIDIHLVVDYSKLKETNKELVDGYFNAMRMLYNFNHNIKIKGHDAEVYVEDSTVQPQSSGVYSIKNDKWVVKPTKDTIDVDDDAVELKYQALKDEIDYLVTNNSSMDYINAYYKKLFDMRKSALSAAGEFSVENLAFKKLRNDGSIDKLRSYMRNRENKNLSLENK